MKKNLPIFTACLLLIVCVYNWLDNSESCALCNSCSYHEPCIISLATGDIIPLTVYDPHPFRAGELAEEQTDGYLSIIHYPGFSGCRDTNSQKTIGKVQAASVTPLRRAFCHPCHKELSKFSQIGFALIDIHDPTQPSFYPLEDGTEIFFRCYEIAMALESEANSYRITVQGTLGK